MIDLNLPEFDSPITTILDFKKQISNIPAELIYYKYLGSNFKIGGVCTSPFRVDSRPSFGVFIRKGELIFNDFGSNDSGTVVDFLFKYYKHNGISSIKEMSEKFKADFANLEGPELLNGMRHTDVSPEIIRRKKPFKLEVRVRKFRDYDAEYWGQYGISIGSLRVFNVFPISLYFVNGISYMADRLAYVYVESKDNKTFLKVYQPLNKTMKWLSNTNFSVHQGYRILPKDGQLLVYTKSLKDVMALREVAGIDSIGLQGEKARVKESVRAEYASRFTYNLTLFDNDTEGINLFNYFKNNYNIDGILIPKEFNSKDFSDLVKNTGRQFARKIITELIINKLDEYGSGSHED